MHPLAARLRTSIRRFDNNANAGGTSMAEPTLERGSKGDDVSALQEALIELDFKPGAVDGVFGVLTESAAKSFQVWAQLVADGIVGERTWEKLDDADKSDPTLKEGSKGIAVRGLQRRLTEAGYEVEIDGVFGPDTEARVKAYQEANGLDADGIVGPQTWDRLRGVESD